MMVSRGQCRAIKSRRVTRRDETDICRLLRVQAVHDAGVKKKNHVILVGTIVERPVGWVVVILQRGSDLTETRNPA